MVTIKFYSDPSVSESTTSTHSSVLEYLIESEYSREDLLDLRFFHDELLCQEIDHSDPSFLDLSEGTIAVTRDSMMPRGPETWIYVAIAVIVAVVTVLLMPKLKTPGLGSDQSSATNRLGNSNNEPRINERIDDIFGSLSKHTPPLWQVPYRIGVNNEETEVLLVCVGRGKYEMSPENIYDGDTRVLDIDNAKFSKYEPSTYPGNGSPSLQIGDDIDEKIGVYRQSNDLNPAELLPPNDLVNSNLKWELTGTSPTVGTMVAIEIPDGFDFQDYYNVGDMINMSGINYFADRSDVPLFNTAGEYQFNAFESPVDLGEANALEYEILTVTSNTITVDIPVSASTAVKDAWAAMSSYTIPEYMFHAFNNSLTDFYTLNNGINVGDWFEDPLLTIYVSQQTEVYRQLVGPSFNGVLGPFVVPDDATEIILNFTSESGFYKLDDNNETPINANIEVVIRELDAFGVPTGSTVNQNVGHSSNESIRKSVFTTKRISLPYTKQSVSATRTTNRDKSTGISNVDIIKWRDLYSFEPVTGLDFGDVTLAHIVIPSNSDSQLVKERKQNMNVTRLITEYLGNDNFGPVESFATDDFAQILTHISLDPFIGRLTIDEINADGFLALSDQIETYFGSSEMVRFGHDFDDTNVTYQDSFIRICNVVNCLPYVQNGVYDAFFEGLQETSSVQITCRNKIADSESREQTFEREFDGVEVTYRDEDTAVSEVVYLPSDRSALNPDRVDLTGCVTKLQAFRYAARRFNKQVHSRLKVSFDVDEFGRNIIPGKRIDSPDSTRFTLREGVTDGYKVYEGEVIEVVGLNVELSEPVTFTGGEDHYIVFTNENGDNSESILCTKVDDFTVLLNTLPSESIYDGYSKDRTKYTFVSEQLRDSIALIPQTIEFKLSDDGDEINTIGSINYSPKYYKDDLEFPS